MQEVNFLHSSLIKFILDCSPHPMFLSRYIYLSPFWHLSKSVGMIYKKWILHIRIMFLRSHIVISNLIKHVSWLIFISVYYKTWIMIIMTTNWSWNREKMIHLLEAIKSESFDTMSKKILSSKDFHDEDISEFF